MLRVLGRLHRETLQFGVFVSEMRRDRYGPASESPVTSCQCPWPYICERFNPPRCRDAL
jgi:hypothetical protein